MSTIVVATQSVSESSEVALSAEELIFFDEILEAILGTTEILIGLATIPHHLH